MKTTMDTNETSIKKEWVHPHISELSVSETNQNNPLDPPSPGQQVS